MLEFLYTWRGELVTVTTIFSTWAMFKFILKQDYWHLCLAGMLFGLATEVFTEPEWNYHLAWYIWRDVSPFTIAGWGPLMAILVANSNKLYKKLFKRDAGKDPRLILCDIIVGVPLMTAGESFGLHILKTWNYSPVLNWHINIPFLNYPLEGMVAMLFFVAIYPSAVRYWKKD